MLPSQEETANYQDLFNIPDHYIGEIINGHLSAMPRPAFPHAVTASALIHHIGGPFHYDPNGIGGWWIVIEPELHLKDNSQQDILVPDLAGWKRERVKQLPTGAYTNIVPDWICEILSPSTGKQDRADKMPLYAKYGVNYIWLVDPILKTLEVYERQNQNWLLLNVLAEDAKASVIPFDAIEFPLNTLWI